MKIMLCGGGTMGHITPAIALYDVFREQGHQAELMVAERDAEFIPDKYNFKTIKLQAPGNPIKNIKFILGFGFALMNTYSYFKKIKPECVIGMGGYISLPALWAAKILKIKIFICEQNSIAGKANRVFYKYANMSYLTFNKTLETMPKGKVYGNPVRQDFYITSRDSARDMMQLDKDDRLLIIMGGSQGALKLNELFLQAIPKIVNGVSNLKILWLCGVKWHKMASSAVKEGGFENVSVFAHYRDMPKILHAADFAVSRAGSSSIAELIAVRLPSLLVPFPYATDNHQYFNAKELSDRDMAYLMQENVLDKEKLENIIINALNDKERLLAIREHIGNVNKENSASLIAGDILSRITNR